MKIGFIGLGKMGSNMVFNLIEHNYQIVGYNRSPEPTRKLARNGLIPTYSIKEFISKLPKEKIIWLMVPPGHVIDKLIQELKTFLKRGDVIIDGGNSYYTDSIRRYDLLKRSGIGFLDCGVAGGVEGARKGTALTIGGDKNVFKKCEKVFKTLSFNGNYIYLGKSGAGHFAKIVHNGIVCGMLETYAEGFEILKKSNYHFDLYKISNVWNMGSLVNSPILKSVEKVLKNNSHLHGISGVIGGGETGRWAYGIARKEKVEAKSLAHALKKRKNSEKEHSFATKLSAAVRNEFGGHPILKK